MRKVKKVIPKPEIKMIAGDEFFVRVPLDKLGIGRGGITRVMAKVVDLLQIYGEEVWTAKPSKEGFCIKMIIQEGTFSALYGAVAYTLEGFTLNLPDEAERGKPSFLIFCRRLLRRLLRRLTRYRKKKRISYNKISVGEAIRLHRQGLDMVCDGDKHSVTLSDEED